MAPRRPLTCPSPAVTYRSLMQRITHGEAFSATLGRAKDLALSGADDDVAIEELRRVAGRVEVLRDCTTAFPDEHGFPIDTIRRWLLLAAGEQPSVLPPDQASQEAEQRALLAMPPEKAFRLLAEREPMLIDLERQARDWTSVRLTGLPRLLGLVARDKHHRRAAAGQLLHSARGLVGRQSFQVDPLLASPAAEAVVRRRIGTLVGLIGNEQEPA